MKPLFCNFCAYVTGHGVGARISRKITQGHNLDFAGGTVRTDTYVSDNSVNIKDTKKGYQRINFPSISLFTTLPDMPSTAGN